MELENYTKIAGITFHRVKENSLIDLKKKTISFLIKIQQTKALETKRKNFNLDYQESQFKFSIYLEKIIPSTRSSYIEKLSEITKTIL